MMTLTISVTPCSPVTACRWAFAPQWELATDVWPHCDRHGWICYNLVITQILSGLAEIVLFLTLMFSALKRRTYLAVPALWLLRIGYRLVGGTIAVWVFMLVWRITPWIVSEMFDLVNLYVGCVYALWHLHQHVKDLQDEVDPAKKDSTDIKLE
eukprot:TRINITY_DN6554_c0_g1_i2.p1 TRINITY_DN6554_c0_g1~~TRINITY_DN6554_c0_g1_i2.p1  ORF type:complete len:154 (+),score=17.79 TRINITY_DN6554_c0_g1_i2:678-1139(+)